MPLATPAAPPLTAASSAYSRRRFLTAVALGGSALALAHPGWAAPKPVVVLTAYPDEVVSRFEAAFEKAHPQYRLQMVWRMPHEALPYLREPHQSGVDVYWSASPRTYATLARERLLRPLEIDRRGLPDHIGHARLADADGYYTATEMAGYGFVVNTAALAAKGLPIPADWSDLADPRYAGLIALPSPARVGFAPPIVEILLQALGWDRGWALWSRIVANASLMERGATFVTDEVASGRLPIGISIDFFSAAAIAGGAPLTFVYPRHNGINPAHIAITREAPNPVGAKAFVDFVLSPAGQSILLHPDIRKLPVRPAVYAHGPKGYYAPFEAAGAGVFDYDSELALPRLGLSTAVFEQMLAAPAADVKALWARVYRAEAAGQDMAHIRAHLERPPLSEAEANRPELQQLFRNRLEGNDVAQVTALESRWRTNADWQRALARAALERIAP
jgi:phosphoglycerate transport regulatory protein PgtC